jgi:hypothetical protein
MSTTKQDSHVVKITNAVVKYAKVHRAGKAYEPSNPDEWSINFYPSPDDREALMAHGCNPKQDKEGAEYWIAKRKVVTKDGKAAQPPQVVDHTKAACSDDIGNGSVCNLIVTLFPWEMNRRRGVYVYLNAVQVVNLITYGDPVAMFDTFSDGDGTTY